MKITRKFTTAGQDPFDSVKWTTRSSKISNPDGSIVFEMKDAEVPASWSQLATDIAVSKYFRKAGVPQMVKAGAIVAGGWQAAASKAKDGLPPGVLKDADGKVVTGPERSVRQLVHRLAGCWRHWGEAHKYFDSAEDAQAFYDELVYMLLHQMAAPNSPQWFNTGLHWAYGIEGPAQGHWVPDPKTGEVSLAGGAYEHPQPHACFIQSVSDDLVNEGGIMDLWVREARLFKYGSGTGTNFSRLRGEGEPLSGGGKSSGLMSWLKIGDRAASAIKSGGTTRRAAKMVCLDMDHPDIESFVNWKVREEIKVAAMVEGLTKIAGERASVHDPETIGETARRLGLKLDFDFNGEAYASVSGQNSNNSVRVPDKFFDAVDSGAAWETRWRTNGELARTVDARKLWDDIAYAAWRCADPGVQFDSTINAWHTCPGAGRINASNPCVTGDTLVATGEGYRRIGEMVGQCAEVINARGERSFVDSIFPTGEKPVYRLTTQSGYSLRLTADHRVLTVGRGDVPACELTVDDEVVLERPGFGDDYVPAAFGEVIGAALGDGCVSRGESQDHLQIALSGEEYRVGERLAEGLDVGKEWLGLADGRSLRAQRVHETATGLRVTTTVARVLEAVERYAVLDAGSAGKSMTDAVFGLDRASQAAILRGLFTADGTVNDSGEKSQYVALDSTSLELLRQVQLLLLGFGIKAKLYQNRRALGHDHAELPDGKGGTKAYPVRQVHSLRISRSSRVVFERAIGFMPESSKADRLATLNARVTTYNEKFTDRVRSLEACGVEHVFDLTEPTTHHFVANGIVVHNCSEYMFLDNTACNLASLNLMKFYDAPTRHFDVRAYEHAIDLWTMVLEISVLMAAYPSKEVAELSWKYRTLGLGYANLGAMLMQAGIPYDSEDGRAICGCLTAILTGGSYRMSAKMAKEHGPFPGYKPDADNMLRVMRNHRRAAHGVKRGAAEWEGLNSRTRPVPIDQSLCRSGRVPVANTPELLDRARMAWDQAIQLGEAHGYRNAQTTVIAPTGTIGLLMDCDTTGVEPDFALVKFKKLAGGGYFKIANASVKPALEAMGYDERERQDMLRYLLGTLHLEVPLPAGVPGALEGQTLAQWLRGKGLIEEDIKKINDALPGVFEIGFAFSAWALGEAALERVGIDPQTAQANPGFNLLRELGLTREQVGELNLLVCGTQTLEGAPHLKAEHLPVFDCANTCGPLSTRYIEPQGHIRMMAASQPFISGAISKTINLPNDASVEDIKSCYRLSWELGLKANALYRDGCKLSQPLSTKSDAKDEDGAKADVVVVEVDIEDTIEVDADGEREALEEVGELAVSAAKSAGEGDVREVVKTVERIVHRPMRRRLPDTRGSLTHKFNIAGHEGYLTVGLYEDGLPGELFITMAKEGSTIGGLMDSLGTAVSVALQYGVPLESLVRKFTHQRFEPAGMTTNRDIPIAKSLVDYIFRWMGIQFIPGYREANSPRRGTGEAEASAAKPEEGGADSSERLRATAGPTDGPGGRVERAAMMTRDAQTPAGDDAGQAGPRVRAAREAVVTTMRHLVVEASETSVRRSRTAGYVESGRAGEAAQLSSMLESMADAPACDVCGTITVRNGTCYKCLNCGNSMGCS